MVGKVVGTIRSDKQEQKSRGKKESKNTYPQKFAPTLALRWYSQDLIGRAKLFGISAANQNQGGKSAWAFPVWPAKRRVLQRAV